MVLSFWMKGRVIQPSKGYGQGKTECAYCRDGVDSAFLSFKNALWIENLLSC
jgi:hypothetical protein